MHSPRAAIFNGLGRRVALSAAVCAMLMLVAFIWLDARHAQRESSQLQQQQVERLASQAAGSVARRIRTAIGVLRTLSLAERDVGPRAAALWSRAETTGMFAWMTVTSIDENGIARAGSRQFQLAAGQLESLQSGRSVLLSFHDPAGEQGLYVARQALASGQQRLLVAQFAPEWLWEPARNSGSGFQLLGIDAGGTLSGSLENSSALTGLFLRRMSESEQAAAALPVAWHDGHNAWIGSVAALARPPGASGAQMAMVAAAPVKPLAYFLTTSIANYLPLGALAVALALIAGAVTSAGYLPTLRKLRRALVQLPERRIPVEVDRRASSELLEVVDAFNRTAMVIESQRETAGALADIDTLLIAGGEFEFVIDRVLTLVCGVTQARNVGVTLMDSDAEGHGRLFAVSADGDFPVNRVVVEEQMATTLLESRTGLTIMRCEDERHSFLKPLQADGSQFFWVWPVVVNDRLAAILSVGYVDPPANGAHVAGCGTQCAQRLSAVLSSSSRAEQLYRQAHFDPLTQLPNRLLFRDRLAQELTAAVNAPSRGALIYIDLDHFKKVNDSLGHKAGDQLLAIIAQRLRACVKEGDTVARLGGDEFTVIVRNVQDPDAASAVAERIIHSLALPVSISGKDHQVRGSIGIALFPDDGAQIDELLHNADLAMYRAKSLGQGEAVFYNPRMSRRATRVAESGLTRAFKRHEFALYFQPQYGVPDGRITGVEALLRWQSPREGVIASADFIPAAEESGLIVDLGGWVIEAACAQIAQWQAQGMEPPRMSVNLSVQQLRDPGLLPNLRRVLDRHHVDPARLDLELKEAALTDAASQNSIAELAQLGVGLVLDDFGTGLTALNNLRRYPVHAVKIDRSFIEEVAVNPAAAALASSIIVMAHAVGKRVIAEGVETVEQLEFLRERGCDVAQGYYLARPLPVAAMSEMLQGMIVEDDLMQASRA
ncbi:MAG: EAL domain-containing protein [Pseudomonadota bacterium]